MPFKVGSIPTRCTRIELEWQRGDVACPEQGCWNTSAAVKPGEFRSKMMYLTREEMLEAGFGKDYKTIHVDTTEDIDPTNPEHRKLVVEQMKIVEEAIRNGDYEEVDLESLDRDIPQRTIEDFHRAMDVARNITPETIKALMDYDKNKGK